MRMFRRHILISFFKIKKKRKVELRSFILPSAELREKRVAGNVTLPERVACASDGASFRLLAATVGTRPRFTLSPLVKSQSVL